jgi:hypothetical protein
MKKIFALAALTLAVSAASAAGLSAFGTYDYDRANKNATGWNSQHEAHEGIALSTVLGTVDASLAERELVTSTRDKNLGFELGYSNGLSLGPVALVGRASYGRENLVNADGGGFTGNSEYYGLSAEADLKVGSVTTFAGYRYRHGLNAQTVRASDRYTVGAELPITKSVAARVGYALTKQDGYTMNGITTALTYKF